ncbi:chemotaxis response regulator protein-glutamate methylesterase [Paenibacillus sp. 598K]|uniref:protein-glutamate methylesterase/protein-glutamine glutaminase n=1 Tax=Paenibacillus sp. 598K TaxID=1117987 RepID=UPI000FF95F0E|nr:chemotaxis response regulator protein-glutamate methylesterase [Paenibacillus sp. 598K]GBF72019.1 chemotaxis response regulator protein-glutamate methylesterase [Paenibacillus sp. 598K]
MTPHRVLVVDDSPFMRKIITDLIVRNRDYAVVATAKTGAEAVEAARLWKPDIITMDLEMPEMNGLDALRRIMAIQPTPIIMLAGISEDNTTETIKALQLGAFDFIRKPSGDGATSIEKVAQQLQDKLRAAMSVKAKATRLAAPTVRLPEPPSRPAPPQAKPAPPQVPFRPITPVPPAPPESPSLEKPGQGGARRQTDKPTYSVFSHVVAIGTSTGGPRALHEVISSLPAGFAAPVLVVQHMPPRFTRSLADRLDSFSEVLVVEAEQGMRVRGGTVYIAPGGYHMELAKDLSGYYIHLHEQAPRHGHRPSVDTMFESLIPRTELKRHAVLMTGMGSDGAIGMKQLLEHGAVSAVAEAEETCVVYGMPRSAIERGAVTKVLPLTQIARHLVGLVD